MFNLNTRELIKQIALNKYLNKEDTILFYGPYINFIFLMGRALRDGGGGKSVKVWTTKRIDQKAMNHWARYMALVVGI